MKYVISIISCRSVKNIKADGRGQASKPSEQIRITRMETRSRTPQKKLVLGVAAVARVISTKRLPN